MRKEYGLIVIYLCLSVAGLSQSKTEKRNIFSDTLDGAFDLSDFLIEKNGFAPIPFLITEPAFGGFGGGFAPVFLKKRPPSIDTVGGVIKKISTAPDITGAALIYTANQSWAIMAFRSGTWLKHHMKYRIAGGYANMNLNYYRVSPIDNAEHAYEFNFRTTPFFGYLMKQIRGTRWSAGIQYTFLKVDLKPASGDLPAFVMNKEIKSINSMPGLILEFDGRDNIFTPDKGLRLHANMSWSDPAFGSDYQYSNLDVYGYYYHPLSRKTILGLRYEMQQAFGSPPFYLLPFIDLRGLPIARYQGNIFSVFETEVRWDFVPRWSLVGFAGSGKAYSAWSDFSSSSWVSSGGGGFRYLMARKFKLRMGMDVARGPEQWAYYIVFGSSWTR